MHTHTNLQHLSPSHSNLCFANQSESLTVWNNERNRRHLSMQFLFGTLPTESQGRAADQEIHSSSSCFWNLLWAKLDQSATTHLFIQDPVYHTLLFKSTFTSRINSLLLRFPTKRFVLFLLPLFEYNIDQSHVTWHVYPNKFYTTFQSLFLCDFLILLRLFILPLLSVPYICRFSTENCSKTSESASFGIDKNSRVVAS
jgi:hypothetical protein